MFYALVKMRIFSTQMANKQQTGKSHCTQCSLAQSAKLVNSQLNAIGMRVYARVKRTILTNLANLAFIK